MNTLKNKVLSVSLLAATSLWAVMPVASAQTVDQLQAQIAALMAQIQALQAQVAGGSSMPSTTSCTFTRDLTVGMRGDDVKCLQGYLQVSPQSGYFGPLTKAAVQKWQSENGLPSTGYFGPMSRAKYSALVAVVTPTTPPTTGTTTATTTSTTTPSAPTVSTPGVEAILTAEYAPQPGNNPTLRVGQQDVSILGVRVKAKQGDALVQRLTIKSTNQNIYTKVFSSLALYDGNTKLAEITNPASAYVKQATNDFRITFSGFSVLVPKDGSKDLTVKGTLYSSIDSTYRISYGPVLSVPTDGVRAIDGAGVNQYATPSGSRAITVEQSESELATLSLAKDASSPKTTVLVSDSYGDVKDKPMLVVALTAEKGRVKITDIIATTTGSATFSSLSLYDGSNLVANVGVSGNGPVTFSNLSELYVDKDQTKLLTIKADFSGATTTFATATVQVMTSGIVAERDDATSATINGSTATSDTMRITSIAPVLTLKSFAATWTRNAQEATGTLASTLQIDIKAEGSDIYISKTPSNAFKVVKVPSTGSTSTVSSVYYDGVPTNVTEESNSYRIAKGQTATFKVKTSDSFVHDDKVYYLKVAVGDGSLVDWGTSDGSSTGGTDIDFLDSASWRTNTVTAN